jgi:Flp pilus assembly protein protease CpaA
VDDPAEIARRKRRSNRAVLAGVCLMAVALLASAVQIAPSLATTAGAVAGFVLLMYGVHVGWLVFYDRESDGPPS